MNIPGALSLLLGAVFSAYVFMPKKRVLDYSLDPNQPGDQFLFNLLIAPVAIVVNLVASLPGAARDLAAGRLHSRVPATILIAIGAFFPTITDSLNRAGSTELFQAGQVPGRRVPVRRVPRLVRGVPRGPHPVHAHPPRDAPPGARPPAGPGGGRGPRGAGAPALRPGPPGGPHRYARGDERLAHASRPPRPRTQRTVPDARPWTALGPPDAPGIVFLHGTRLTRAQWWPQLRRLAALVPVRRGGPAGPRRPGRPSRSPSRRRPTLVRAAIEAEIPSGRAVIVGLSLGGYVAIDTAEAYPDRVAGLVLAGCSGGGLRADVLAVPLLPRAAGACARAALQDVANRAFFRLRYRRADRGADHRGRLLAAGRGRGARRCSSGAATWTVSAGCGRPSSWSTGRSTRSSGREASTGRRPAGGVATSSSRGPCTCRTWIARAPSPAWSPAFASRAARGR